MVDYLERLHREEINILQAVHDACEKMGIKYVIISGTLLGAVRHKGFIPWDDDIDLGMSRSDFDLFLKCGQEYLPSHLFIQHYTTEPCDNKIFIKVRNRLSTFIENDTERLNICHGIYIDIFPFDKCINGKERKEYNRRTVFNSLVQCYSVNAIKTIQNKAKRGFAFLIHFSFCKFIPIYRLLQYEEFRRKKLDKIGEDCYLLNMFVWNGTVTYSELFEREKYQFEDKLFWGPKKYDGILKKYYGDDYMVLPPIDRRITHKPKVVSFDKYI